MVLNGYLRYIIINTLICYTLSAFMLHITPRSGVGLLLYHRLPHSSHTPLLDTQLFEFQSDFLGPRARRDTTTTQYTIRKQQQTNWRGRPNLTKEENPKKIFPKEWVGFNLKKPKTHNLLTPPLTTVLPHSAASLFSPVSAVCCGMMVLGAWCFVSAI